MRTAWLIAALLCIAMGAVWIGQGLGFIHWPESSFMLDQRPWATRGALLVVLGIVLLLASLRRR
jgi:hypothetical protein